MGGLLCAFWVVAVIATLALQACSGLWDWQEYTGLPIARGASNVHTYDDHEFCAIAHATLSEETLSRVLPRFKRFTPGEQSIPFATPEKLPHAEHLPEQWQALAPGAELYEAGECNGASNWYALLDRSSRSIWIEFTYVDPGDSPPGCGMTQRKKLLEDEREAVEQRLRYGHRLQSSPARKE